MHEQFVTLRRGGTREPQENRVVQRRQKRQRAPLLAVRPCFLLATMQPGAHCAASMRNHVKTPRHTVRAALRPPSSGSGPGGITVHRCAWGPSESIPLAPRARLNCWAGIGQQVQGRLGVQWKRSTAPVLHTSTSRLCLLPPLSDAYDLINLLKIPASTWVRSCPSRKNTSGSP